jgi:hypothetical protein
MLALTTKCTDGDNGSSLTLSLLAIYVDTKFITDSFLHHSGGFLFYLPALGLLGGLLWWFRKAERKKTAQEPCIHHRGTEGTEKRCTEK